jgi:hypothetical protein
MTTSGTGGPGFRSGRAPCRAVARSRRLSSVLVEFEDGVRVVTSRYAVRLA